MARVEINVEEDYEGPLFIIVHKETNKLGTTQSFKTIETAKTFIKHNDTTGDYIVIPAERVK